MALKNKKEKVKEKTGAKPKCTPELIKRAEELSGLMMLDYQIWESLDISKDAFYRYQKENSNFYDALRKGRAKTLETVTNSAIMRCKDDPVMMMFFLKNKGAWLEKNQERNLEIKQKEYELKEKLFQLSTEKFVNELCEKHNLDKKETLETLNKHLDAYATCK